MIEQLRGIIVHKNATFAVLECGNVGYGVHFSAITGETLPEIGMEVTLLTHLVVREDAMILYAFNQTQEKELFLKLIGVTGIGPKMAQRILSGVSVGDFLGMIAREDKAALGKIKGIGKKTSEMLLLALKDKVLSISAIEGGSPKILLPNAQQEAVAALHTLGVKDPAAQKAVEKAANNLGLEASVSQLIPEALKHI